MAVDAQTLSPKARLDHLARVMSSQRFLEKQGLGKEVPFFICPYRPEEALEMDRIRVQLRKKLEAENVTTLEINLYDLAIELLKQRDIWDEVLAQEPDIPKAELKELLQGVLDPATHLIPAIGEELNRQQFDILFLSGVGEVFPYIRSHNVLNNLQSTAKEKPTVMFFPGTYTHERATGASLDLFSRLHDDKYYRAFNIFHYEV